MDRSSINDSQKRFRTLSPSLNFSIGRFKKYIAGSMDRIVKIKAFFFFSRVPSEVGAVASKFVETGYADAYFNI